MKNTLNNKTILVTGCTGFIGYYLCNRLLKENDNIKIIGIDSINDYYDVSLKEYRLSLLNKYNSFIFIKGNISDKDFINKVFNDYKINIVINLAAYAGVRYSIEHPDLYIESNIIGFYNILDACRNNDIEHLVYASSSSVYGNNNKVPYSIEDKVDNPVSVYAATKKSNELLAHAYSNLYNIPSTGLRFFTVYGPLGRPDMAYYSFTNKLINNEKINIYNYGNCKRDFTYIDDIIEGVIRVISKPPKKEDNYYKIYNIGNSKPIDLLKFVNILKEELIKVDLLDKDYNLEDHIELLPMQEGDVEVTCADTKELEKDFNYKPNTDIRTGLRKFVKWYKEYYKDNN